jgi:putative acetyltransferase
MLAIRSYVPHDADATIDIFLRSVREVASRDYTPAQVTAWAQVEDRDAWARRRASRPTWIATCDGAPVGFSDLEADGHLDMMFVHPQFQGRGVASLLLATVERTAKAQAIPLITTEASVTARPFFLSRGFGVVAAQEVWRRGEAFRNFRMEKRLTHAG